MAAFVEQRSESEGWHGHPALRPSATDLTMSPSASAGRAHPHGDGGFHPSASDRRDRASLLTRVVEAEILPRLAMLRGANAASSEDSVEVTTTDDDTANLVRLLLAQEGSGAEAFITELQHLGSSAVSLYLGVISQAARALGMLWEEDRCDFTQVTIGLGRLQQVVRFLSPEFQAAAVAHPQPPNILLIPAPGEQHTFGLMIVAEFFQRDGWCVTGGPATTPDEAIAIARDTWIDVAGLTIAAPPRLEGLTNCIRTLRRVSRNRDLSIMVGGPLLLRYPDVLVRIGADVCAADALSAVRQASGLIALRTAAD